MLVTLVGVPRGNPHGTVRDPTANVRFHRGVSVEIDDPDIAWRLESVAALGYTFAFDEHIAPPTAPDDVPAPASPDAYTHDPAVN